MLCGGCDLSIDDKGRVIIPLKLRLLLGDKFVITRGADHCLWVFTSERFLKLHAHLEEQALLNSSAVFLRRFFCGDAVDSSADSQGRVALPAKLRAYAGIEKEVKVIGASGYVEIWNKNTYDTMMDAADDEFVRACANETGLGSAGSHEPVS